MLLCLLVYSYATDTFSSRRIATFNLVMSRCATFERIFHCAALSQILRVGDITLAVEGTKILANASKHSALSHAHVIAQMIQLEDAPTISVEIPTP